MSPVTVLGRSRGCGEKVSHVTVAGVWEGGGRKRCHMLRFLGFGRWEKGVTCYGFWDLVFDI